MYLLIYQPKVWAPIVLQSPAEYVYATLPQNPRAIGTVVVYQVLEVWLILQDIGASLLNEMSRPIVMIIPHEDSGRERKASHNI